MLKEAGTPALGFGAMDPNHTKINANLGRLDDPVTKARVDVVADSLKK